MQNEPILKNSRRGLAIVLFLIVGAILCIGTVATLAIMHGPSYLKKMASNSTHLNATGSAVNRFHEQLTAGKYAEIYEEASPELKQAISAGEWIVKSEQLMKMSTPVNGVARAGNTKIISWKIKYKAFDGAYVTLQCKTQYAIGRFDETFVFVIRSGQPQLYSYGNQSFDILEEVLKGVTVQIAEPSPTPDQSSASTQ